MNAPNTRPPPEPQRQLLALLDALDAQGEGIASADFAPLLALYAQEPGAVARYETTWTPSGPISFTAEADRRKLVERGLMADDAGRWLLTARGRTAATNEVTPAMRAFAMGKGALRDEGLAAAVRPHAVVRPADGPALVTIGYEGRSPEAYLNELLRVGITVLCDVRRNPLSRKLGFAKSTLAKACAAVGIRYEHVPELGIASEQRKSLETQADYDALFDEYARESLPRQGAALAKIAEWMRAGERIALTCYERAPEQCHRHCVAEALAQSSGTRARDL